MKRYLLSVIFLVFVSFFIVLPFNLLNGEPVVEDTCVANEEVKTNFEIEWESLSQKEKDRAKENALWIARLLMSEDKRVEPWIMMTSIVLNRVEQRHRGQTTVYGVIHDRYQFSAVRTWTWRKYKRLKPNNGNELFDKAYQVALDVVVVGVPDRYKEITHAYYPVAMTEVYGYDKHYPEWDTPNRPMKNRSVSSGWVYGAAD